MSKVRVFDDGGVNEKGYTVWINGTVYKMYESGYSRIGQNQSLSLLKFTLRVTTEVSFEVLPEQILDYIITKVQKMSAGNFRKRTPA